MIEEKLEYKITAVDAARFCERTVQYIHKQLKEKNLISYKSNNRVFFGYETACKIFNIKFEKRIISFQIVKGGTGKTSLAHSFAIRANLYGAKVLCIDLDQQGNLSQAFNIKANDLPVMVDIINGDSTIKEAIVKISLGLNILPSRIENAVLDNCLMLNKYPLDRVYKELFNEVKDDYDIIIIDCPPALSQSVTAASLASDTIICPVTPEQFSLSGLNISYEENAIISKRFNTKCDLKIVLNKFDTRTALSNEVLSAILNHKIYKNIMCSTFIRSCQDFPNMLYAGLNIFNNLQTSVAKEDIDLFTLEILQLNKLKK